MLLVSLLQSLGFPSDPASVSSRAASLQSPPKSAARRPPESSAHQQKQAGATDVRKRGITTNQPVSAEQSDAVRGSTPSSAPPRHQAASGTERRSFVKAPAPPTAKNRQPAASAGKGRSASAVAPASKAAAKTAAKPASAKTVVGKPAAKAATKTTSPAVKKAAVPKAQAAAKPVVAPKAAAKSASKPAPVKVATPSVKAVTKQKAPAAPPPVAAPAPIIIEPTPRPLGKRAAKKVMMEQMTQAAVVPTHAPNAAKATFSLSNERVMTAPAPTAIQKDPKRANNWKSLPVEQLTDQDVQSMPDSEYMNDVQLAFFRRKLSQLKEDMLANAGETTEHLREDTVVVPDPADRATIEEEHALELRTRDRERKLLKKIEQAIARIDSGDYGYCEETGEPIGVGRLMARPTASLSLEAQQRRELKQKMFGD
ncbi:RNA polymerase-binding protein DksA [Hydrogenophaga luteola]|uniref:RNA polymerase-binding transcription factor DksA n=1 Tax=Hydrogenophaga luteola TaxID=1591122 RepID=A0ABV7W4T1_9BURK